MSAVSSASVTTKEIWALTWPQALMMLCQFMVGFTDVVVAGHIDKDVQAAMGIISQCLMLLLVVGSAIANGGVAAMSQAIGAGLDQRAERYVGLLSKFAGVLCLLTVFVAYYFRREILASLEVPKEIFPLTEQLWILFLFWIPGSYIATFSGAIFRSRKNVMVPLIASAITCVVNVFGAVGLGLGYFGLPMLGGKGLILAALIAVYVGAVINLFVLIRKGYISRKSFSAWYWEKKALPYIIKVALPSGGLQVLWQLGYLLLFSIVATLPSGVGAMAGFTAGNRIEGILFLPTVAFSMTGSILVGHCLGAGNRAEAKRVALKVMGASAFCMTLIAIIVYQFIPEITQYVTPDISVQPIASSYLRYNFMAIPFTCVSIVAAGIMNGAGATIFTFITYGSAIWLVRLPLAWYLGHKLGMDAPGIFIAMLVSQICQAIVIFFILLRCNWYRFSSTAKRMK